MPQNNNDVLFFMSLQVSWQSFSWALLGSLLQLQTSNSLTGAQRSQMVSLKCLLIGIAYWLGFLTFPCSLYVRGPWDYLQAWWLTKRFTGLRKAIIFMVMVCCGERMLTSQQRKKADRKKSNRNQSQPSRYLLPVEFHGDKLNSLCNDAWQNMRSTDNQASSWSLSARVLIWGQIPETCSTHVTDLSYSDHSSPAVKLTQNSPKPQACRNNLTLRQDIARAQWLSPRSQQGRALSSEHVVLQHPKPAGLTLYCIPLIL